MEFIDNTGHIFSIKSYDENPLSLEYSEGDYIFWVKDSSVSVNNYYIKPIRFLIKYDEIKNNLEDFELEITNNSSFFSLISPKYLQNKLENISKISESIDLDKSCFVNKLTLEDFYFDKESFDSEDNINNLIVYSNDNKFIMFPFYVISYSDIEGTFINNITIRYTCKKETSNIITKNFTRDEYYDYLMKKAFSPIKIYSCNENGDNKQYVTTIEPSYDNTIIQEGINSNLHKYEILYADPTDDEITNNALRTDNVKSSLYDKDDEENQINQYLRIRNFRNFETEGTISGGLPLDVYHYIYRLENKLPQGYYIFEGEIYDGCEYCGSIIGTNHDATLVINGINNTFPAIDDRYRNYYVGRLTQLNPMYDSGSFIPDKDSNNNVKGYVIKNNPVLLPQTIDFWFDIDNRLVAENENGATVEIIEYKDYYNYTVISIGCTFVDECEELIINGRNMGIRFPKEILKAIYSSSYYSKYADEKLLKNKLKELLINYMNIKGQCGNVKSMINSLKWFGWNNYVEINKLLKTDNKFQNQFILDYFDIDSTVKDTFKYFNNTNNISLSVLENIETGNNYTQNFNNLFIGEGKPELESLFEKNIEIIKEDIAFYRPYYNFIFNELALKLDCLKYYYKQYFLPIHINILRASITRKVYANTLKMSSYAYETLIDSPLCLIDKSNINVEFPDTNIILFKQDKHIIDSKYNEFSNYNSEYSKEDLYYINENCLSIPFTIIDLNNEFTKNNKGEYIKENDEFIKIPYFFKRISDKEIEDSDTQNATHYSLTGIINNSDDLLDIDEVTRYIKLSEGYFNCKIYLTVTYINQSDTGHYVYKDGKYIYKDKFYKTDISSINLSDKFIEEDYIDDSYNYIKYYNEYIRIDKKDRYNIETIYLINDNNFNYYQSQNQYYKYLVIIPRILNNQIDWLKGYFRLSLNVNGKWFYYDFIIKTPNVYLDLGKLQYKYFVKETNTENIYYPFRQLKSLNPLNFNSFMYQPDLVTINTLFKDEENNKLLTFFDKLLEIRNGDYTMNEFYRKYYRDKIVIPYNEKYFNRIHLFDLEITSEILFNYIRENITTNTNINYILFKFEKKYNEYQYYGFKVVKEENMNINQYYNNFTNEINDNNIIEQNITLNNLGPLISFYNSYYRKYFNKIQFTKISSVRIFITRDNKININPFYTSENIYISYYGKLPYNDKFIIESSRYLTQRFVGNNIVDGELLYNKIKTYFINNRNVKYIKYLLITLDKSILLENNDIEYYPIKNSYTHILLPVSNDIDYNIFNKQIENGYNDINNPINNPYYLIINNCLIIKKFLNFNDNYLDDNFKNNFINYFQKIHVDFDVNFTQIDWIYYDINHIEKTNENELYNNLFNSDCSCKLELNENVYYDYYLMHDEEEWYIVAISQYPIASYINKSLLDIHKDSYKIGNYTIKYANYSIDKFLINRMDIIKSNGYNHFNIDDLVIATINNNDYQFNIDTNNKWSINKIYDINNISEINSNTNIAIITNNNKDNLYTPGYYNINFNYTINGLHNLFNHIIGEFKIEKTYQEIEYPILKEITIKKKKYSIDETISDFSILYENNDGMQKITKDILDPSLDWHPIGIKIMNKYYYGPEQDYSIYIGLKLLSISNPDSGFKNSGKQQPIDVPYFGFSGHDIEGLTNFTNLCKKPTGEYLSGNNYVYTQTDYDYWVPKNPDGSAKYPAPNNRYYYNTPWKESGYITIDLLNDDDTLNTELFDEYCAVSDYNGKRNTQIIINNFDSIYDGWKTANTITNVANAKFSPMAACAWRYHTKSTHKGDWYIPSFAEVFFLNYNFNKLTIKFEEIASKYSDYCKEDMLTSLTNNGPLGSGNALWTSTERGASQMWEIHPAQHVHPLSKNTKWQSFPYIQIYD